MDRMTEERLEELQRHIQVSSRRTDAELVAEIRALRADLAAANAERERLKALLYVDDGFGSTWGPCPDCGSRMTVVRPGNATCEHCETSRVCDRLIDEKRDQQAELTALKERLAVVEEERGELKRQVNWERAGNVDHERYIASLLTQIAAAQAREKQARRDALLQAAEICDGHAMNCDATCDEGLWGRELARAIRKLADEDSASPSATPPATAGASPTE